jgi:hypothetical protein
VNDPFSHLVDEAPADGASLRAGLLADAKRGFAKLRKVFVQKPNTETHRPSVLAEIVRGRMERPLDAFLLLHALEPILPDSPLPLSTWAKMLSRGKVPCTSATASRAFDALVDLKLIERENSGRYAILTPLLEDGSGAPWTRPGQDASNVGPGYFTIPYAYWISGLVDQLGLPGKAMLLIMLAETSKNPTFAMAVERAPQWYGFSERTAERGYQQLRDADILLQHRQVVVEPRSPTGLRAVWHRALTDPYSTEARAQLQKVAQRATRQRSRHQTTERTPDAVGSDSGR